MEYCIVRVNKCNYTLFDNMIFHRIHGRERTEMEKVGIQVDHEIYKTLKNENLFIFAAQVGDKFVGWVSAVYIPKVGRTGGRGHLFIDELWVNPGFRRNGIAYALMEKVDAISNKLNVLGLRLYVSVGNNDAILLYKKCGFNSEHDALFMDKERKV